MIDIKLCNIMNAAAAYRKGIHTHKITCEAFIKELPTIHKFLVMAGTEEIRNNILNFKFSRDEIKYLKSLPNLRDIFASSNFDKLLEEFKFTGDMLALAEGEVVFVGEPLIQITSSIFEACLLESMILSALNNIYITSKFARIILASRGRSVIENLLRYKNDNTVSRLAYIAGCHGTSNINAGFYYSIPVFDTITETLIINYKEEKQVFKDLQEIFRSPLFKIDTYGTINNIDEIKNLSSLNSIQIGTYISVEDINIIRKKLDESGHSHTKIVVSGNLDEKTISAIIKSGAPIDVFMVDPKSIYNYLEILYRPVFNHTENRPLLVPRENMFPGKKQIFLDQRDGGWSHLISLSDLNLESEYLTPLLDKNISNGKLVEDSVVDLEISRKYCNAAMTNLHPKLTSLESIQTTSPVYPDDSLKKMFEEAVNGFNMAME